MIRLLDENPEWLEAVRSRILTRELLDMPQTLARFMETTNRRFDALELRMDRVEEDIVEIRADIVEIKSDIVEIKSNIVGIESDIVGMKSDIVGMKSDIVGMKSDIVGIRNDLGYLKAGHARNAAVLDAYNIARDMGLRYVGTVDREEIGRLLDASDTSDLATGDLRSFRRADLIIRAADGEDRTCYVAAEISFTVNGRDTSRAIRNAGLLARFTGNSAFPVVAGVHLDDRVRHHVDSGQVFFYELEAEMLEVE